MLRLTVLFLISILFALPVVAQEPNQLEADFETAVKLAEQGKYQEAASRLRLLAQQGHPGAQYNLGFLYDMGWGVEQDFFAAFNWYSQAADRGLAQAQYNIGVMYYLGRGVNKDIEQAANFYKLAAQGGLAEAQTNLGFLYESGLGVTQDYEQAVEWYKKAAEGGSEKAQFNLAYLYVKGLGTPRDLVSAYKWFTLAGMKGHAQANKNRLVVAEAMTPEQLSSADREIRAYNAEHPLFGSGVGGIRDGSPSSE